GGGGATPAVQAPRARPGEAFRNKTLWLLAALFYVHNYFFYSWTFSIPSYLAHHGYSRSAAGLATSIMSWVSIPTVILVPLMLARLRIPRRVFLWLPSVIFAFIAVSVSYIVSWPIWFL